MWSWVGVVESALAKHWPGGLHGAMLHLGTTAGGGDVCLAVADWRSAALDRRTPNLPSLSEMERRSTRPGAFGASIREMLRAKVDSVRR